MAKAGTAVAVKKKGNVAAVSANVPAYLQKKEMQGRGAQMDQSDLLIPMIRILQSNSPEVNKNQSQYIKGSEIGDILVKGGNPPIIKGETGFMFQACYRRKAHVEWLPRNKGGGGGAGFVASHAEEPADTETAVIKEDGNEKTVRRRKSNGNLIVETRYYGGFIIKGTFDEDGNFEPGDEAPQAIAIPFAASNHTPAKNWNGLIGGKMIGGEKADIWAVYYRVRTISRTKGPNTWSIYDIVDAGPEEDGFPTTYWAPTDEDFERGAALYNQLASEQKRFDEADQGDEEHKPRPM